ncbi:hypothetical protein B0T14DRAFT_500038 [Immersiella caudata]|uniref:Uncharacterized protein n=1 Tax=Immersiella caudata TaxID=314043 RepID=A0AA39U394_9PEZI|nr:hypothetical protein B0T14DRAFT_500038 [Immersiella caudata]
MASGPNILGKRAFDYGNDQPQKRRASNHPGDDVSTKSNPTANPNSNMETTASADATTKAAPAGADAMAAKLKLVHETIDKLTKKTTMHSVSIRSTTRIANGHVDSIQRLNGSEETFRREIRTLHEERKKTTEEISKLSEKLDLVAKENRELKLQIRAVISQNETISTVCDTLHNKNLYLTSEVESLKAIVDKLVHQRSEVKTYIDHQDDDLKEGGQAGQSQAEQNENNNDNSKIESAERGHAINAGYDSAEKCITVAV